MAETVAVKLSPDSVSENTDQISQAHIFKCHMKHSAKKSNFCSAEYKPTTAV